MKDGGEQPGAKVSRLPAAPAGPAQMPQVDRSNGLPASEFARIRLSIKAELEPILAAAKAETGQRGWLEFKYIMGYGPYIYRCWQEGGWRCNTYLGRVNAHGKFVAARTRNRAATDNETR